MFTSGSIPGRVSNRPTPTVLASPGDSAGFSSLRRLVWLRNDLRVADNPALHGACESADDPVLAVYLVSDAQSREHHEGAPRQGFVRATLETLERDLSALGIPLWIERAHYFKDAPAALMRIAGTTGAGELHFNAEYPEHEKRRDRAVEEAASKSGIACRVHHGDVILPPGLVVKDDGQPYSVFTPFKRRWLARLTPADLEALPAPECRAAPDVDVPDPGPALAALPVADHPDWPAGEAAAGLRLAEFLERQVDRYADDRDYPARPGTSCLSPYLAVGAISVRRCYQQAAAARRGGSPAASSGIEHWQSELVWREFYRHVTALFPHISRGHAFRRELDALEWRHDPEALDAWKEGRTGYPMVDAGMRQLAATGFMHNRLRMITSMFLSKHLLIDWREGERHFMEHLRDGDFASNNGGWQWSASTGTDAAPYFRIFNPASQQKKFDPDNAFVSLFVPELGTPEYPAPIVEHPFARQRALQFFRSGK